MTTQIPCANCGELNSSKAIRCRSCGYNIREVMTYFDEEQTKLVAPSEDDLYLKTLHDRRAYFGRSTELYLINTATGEEISCQLANFSTITIGRSPIVGSNVRHIELSAFDAKELGVSRQHAKIRRMNVTIMIEDLNTVNGTMVNMERLSPSKPCVLCDGDEIHLGNLALEIHFKQL